MLKELTHVISTSQLSLPAFELVLLMTLLILFLLFRYARAGILIAYLFTFRWALPIATGLGKEAYFGYLIMGTAVGVLAIVGLFNQTKA